VHPDSELHADHQNGLNQKVCKIKTSRTGRTRIVFIADTVLELPLLLVGKIIGVTS